MEKKPEKAVDSPAEIVNPVPQPPSAPSPMLYENGNDLDPDKG